MIRLIELLTERKQVGTVYHFTSSRNLFKILDNNILRAARSTYNFSANLGPKKHNDKTGIVDKFYNTVSTTRDKNFVKTRVTAGKKEQIGGSDFGIVLDGDKLSDTYQTMAYDETFAPDRDQDEMDDLRNLYGDEMEQLWFGKKIEADKGIKNITRYIKQIIITKKFKNKLANYDYDSTSFPKPFYEQYASKWDYSTTPQKKLEQMKDFIEGMYNIPVEIQK